MPTLAPLPAVIVTLVELLDTDIVPATFDVTVNEFVELYVTLPLVADKPTVGFIFVIFHPIVTFPVPPPDH